MTRTPLAKNRHSMVGLGAISEMKRRFQIDFLRRVGLEPCHRLLDIGCGTLRGGLPLIDYLDTGHYWGVDVRHEVIEEAHKELSEGGLAHKRPSLLPAHSLSELAIDASFDFMWAFSVLIHMQDEVLHDALAFVARHLQPEGVFYANVNIGDHSPAGWQGFPVVWRSLDFYVDAAKRAGLVLEDMGSLREVGHVSNVEAQDSQVMLKLMRLHR